MDYKIQLRSIGFGLLSAFVTISVVEAIGHMMYPVASDIDFNNKEVMKSFVATLPSGALYFVVGAWLIGSMVGGYVATRFDKIKGRLNSVLTGGLVLLFTILNLVMIPHPTWMWITAIVGIIPFCLLGYYLAEKKPSAD